MARPRKPESEKVVEVVSCRLNQADSDSLNDKVAASGLSKSEYVREAVLGDTTTITPVNEECEKSAVYRVYLLSTIANNINQLTKAVNTLIKKNDPEAAIRLLETLEEMRKEAVAL